MTTVSGIVRDTEQNAIAGASVSVVYRKPLVGFNGGAAVQNVRQFTTAGDGTLTMADLVPGHYDITIAIVANDNTTETVLRKGTMTVLDQATQTLQNALDASFEPITPSDVQRAETAADSAEADRILAQTAEGNAATSASEALTSATQAELAALAAGAPIVTTLTDPVPANGTVELLKLDAGLQVYEVVAGAWVLRGWLVGPKFDTVQALLDDTSTTLGPNGTIVEAGGFRYEVVASGEHVTTDGGVKLKVVGSLKLSAFNVIGSGDETEKVQAAFSAITEGAFLNIDVDCTVSDQLTINVSRVRLFGKGTITQTGEFKRTVRFTNATDCHVNQITFVGRGTEHSGSSTSYNGVAAVFFDDPVNCSVYGIQATNHAGGSIRWGGSANGLTVKHNKVSGIGAAGGITTGDNNGDFAIGSISSTADNNVFVTLNRISGHCFGVGVNRGVGGSVSMNIIHDIPGQHGTYCVQMSQQITQGNILYNIANEGIKHQIVENNARPEGVSVLDNLMWNIGQSGVVAAYVTGVTGARYVRSDIIGNRVYDAGFYGFTVLGFRGRINDNTLTKCGAHSALIRGFAGEFSGNELDDADWSALWLEAAGDVLIDGITLVDGARNVGGAASQLRYQTFAYIRDHVDTVVGTPKITIRNPIFRRVNTLGPDVAQCIRTHPNVEIFCDDIDQDIGLPWRFDTLKRFSIRQSVGAAFTISANQNPSTPIYGRGRRELYGNQSPQDASMTDTFIAGDICWNSAPTAGSSAGWICISGGSPGTWVPFGGVEAANAYTPTNVTTSRSFDADTVTVAQLADVLGTLIADMQAQGALK